MPREQVHVFLGHVGIRRSDPDFYALMVMDHVLGSGPGFTSRIARRLRDDEGVDAAAAERPRLVEDRVGTRRRVAVDGHAMER